MALSPSGRRTRFWSSGVSSSGVQTNACSLLTFSQERSDLQQSVKSVSSVVGKLITPEVRHPSSIVHRPFMVERAFGSSASQEHLGLQKSVLLVFVIVFVFVQHLCCPK